MRDKLAEDWDLFRPLEVKKVDEDHYELLNPNDTMALMAAKQLFVEALPARVSSGKAQKKEVPQEEKILRVPLSEVHAFAEHKWRVRDDTPSMRQIISSVQEIGVTEPLIVRPDPKGGYEAISGHRRLRASQLTAQKTVPIIVRHYDDDDAAIRVADCNLHREDEEISLMEKAYNLRMKYEARERKMGRTAKGGQSKGRGDIEFAKLEGMNKNSLHMTMHLTELIPELQDMLEPMNIKMTAAYELSCLDQEHQQKFANQINHTGKLPTAEEVKAVRLAITRQKNPPTPKPEPEQEHEAEFTPPVQPAAVTSGGAGPGGPPAPAVTGGAGPGGPPAPAVTGGAGPGGPPAPAVTGGGGPGGPPAPAVTGGAGPDDPHTPAVTGSRIAEDKDEEESGEETERERDPDRAYDIIIPGKISLELFPDTSVTPLERAKRMISICRKVLRREERQLEHAQSTHKKKDNPGRTH